MTKQMARRDSEHAGQTKQLSAFGCIEKLAVTIIILPRINILGRLAI
jgi:hypothetical protein